MPPKAYQSRLENPGDKKIKSDKSKLNYSKKRPSEMTYVLHESNSIGSMDESSHSNSPVLDEERKVKRY